MAINWRYTSRNVMPHTLYIIIVPYMYYNFTIRLVRCRFILGGSFNKEVPRILEKVVWHSRVFFGYFLFLFTYILNRNLSFIACFDRDR